MLRKILAFLRKDFLTESSYRLTFYLNFFGIFLNILSYFFINRLFGGEIAPHLRPFGVDYFSYVLLSTAFFGYIGVGVGSFADRIGTEQSQGTMEAVLATPTRVSTMLVSLVMWNMILATIDMVVYILLAIFVFKISFAGINVLSSIVILVLTMLSFSGLGILSAGFVMIFKRGNPMGWLISSLEGLVGGIYFPVAVMPAWLQSLSKLFPITYAIRSIQLSVYRGYSLYQLKDDVIMLTFFCIVLLPVGIFSFRMALDKARREGSLAQY